MHWGFRTNGSAYESPIPEGGQATNFVRHLLDRVRHEFCSPAQIVDHVAMAPPELRGMFSFESMNQWQTLDRYWQWPLAQSFGAAETTIKFHGKRIPLWDTDERAWNLRVRHACEIRGEALPDVESCIQSLGAGPFDQVLRRLAGE